MAVSAFLTLALLVVFGVLPAVGGVWLITVSRKKGLGYPGCGQCKYDLSGTLGTIARCPECGSDLKQVGVLPAQGRKNKGALTVGILLLCVPLLCVGAGVLMTYVTRSQLTQARQAAAFAQAQSLQRAALASVATSAADPALVADFRQQHATLSFDMAGYRLGEVGQQLAQAVNNLDEERTKMLRAEQQALIEHLDAIGHSPPA